MADAKIRITARDETKSAFASAGKSLAQLDAQAGAAIASFAALAPTIAAAFAISTFKGAVDLLDQLNDLSDATGASIESLSKLEGVARKNGATMEDVGSILVKFNAALNAADPNSAVAQALQAIGLSAEELKKDDPADAVQKVAKALAGFADDGNKARLVQELFGKSVKAAAPFLKDLAQAGTLNATATTEQARAAEDFNKNLSALSYTASLLARNFTADLLPALNGYLDAVQGVARAQTDVSTTGGGLLTFLETLTVLAANVKYVFKGVGTEIGGLAAQATALATFDLDGVATIRREMLADAEKARKDLDAFERRVLDRSGYATASYSNEGRNAGRSINLPSAAPANSRSTKASNAEIFGPPIPQETLDAMRRLESTDSTKIAALRAELAKLFDIRAAQGGGQVDEAILEVEEALAKFNIEAEKAKQSDPIADLLANTPTAQLERAAASLDLLNAALKDTADPARAQKIQEAMDIVRKGMADIGKDAEKTGTTLSAFADQAQRNIQDALGDTLTQALKGDFQNIEQLWADMLTRMVAQALAAQLNQAIFGAIGSFFGLPAGGTALAGARAMGGPVQAGSTYLVGERGPELFTPTSGGSITPNSALAGGSSTTINVAAGPTKAEVLSAIQVAVSASEAKTTAKLRRAGVA